MLIKTLFKDPHQFVLNILRDHNFKEMDKSDAHSYQNFKCCRSFKKNNIIVKICDAVKELSILAVAEGKCSEYVSYFNRNFYSNVKQLINKYENF